MCNSFIKRAAVLVWNFHPTAVYRVTVPLVPEADGLAGHGKMCILIMYTNFTESETFLKWNFLYLKGFIRFRSGPR
jgi:hypothetical protein